MEYTITHSEETKGWTSFWSYIPGWCCRMGNRFYTLKNGQLWIHNDEDNPVCNNFYGVQGSSSITTVFNEAMADDKIFKAMILEAEEKWDTYLNTNYTESTIKAAEYQTKESRQFAHTRRNEAAGTLKGNAGQGVGRVIGFASGGTLLVQFRQVPTLVVVGDSLYQLNGANQELLGVITNIDMGTGFIAIAAPEMDPTTGFYCYSVKNSRAEGEETRGNYLEARFENTGTANSKMMAVNTEAVKSHV